MMVTRNGSGVSAGFYAERGKRILDSAVSGGLLLLTAPVQLAIAAAIIADDGQPVLYIQERAGRGGRPFRLLKFRSMTVGTDRIDGGYPSPAAVTRVGRILRSTSLDELPQLFNILRGEMSLVGPRPTLVEQAARYDERQRRRLSVRPGLTGLAQIRYRNEAPWSVRIESDLEYVDKQSLLMDLLICVKTVPAVLFSRGQSIGQTREQVDDLGASASVDESGR